DAAPLPGGVDVRAHRAGGGRGRRLPRARRAGADAQPLRPPPPGGSLAEPGGVRSLALRPRARPPPPQVRLPPVQRRPAGLHRQQLRADGGHPDPGDGGAALPAGPGAGAAGAGAADVHAEAPARGMDGGASARLGRAHSALLARIHPRGARMPPAPEPHTTPTVSLRQRLANDAKKREAYVSAFVAGLSALSIILLLVVVQVGAIDWDLGKWLAAVLMGLVGYYGTLYVVLKRGFFHRWIYVVNCCIEVSAPSAFLIADTLYRGPEYALSSPPLVVWGALVMTSALRSWPRLALMAGAMAAAEYAAIYWMLILPRLSPDALVTFRPAMVAARVALLFCFGPLTALTARHIMRQAEQALSAIRAQDLMGK